MHGTVLLESCKTGEAAKAFWICLHSQEDSTIFGVDGTMVHWFRACFFAFDDLRVSLFVTCKAGNVFFMQASLSCTSCFDGDACR